jgi:ABC-type bacteriocin/lantibiotic exporter with double-glycine peptidase domain
MVKYIGIDIVRMNFVAARQLNSQWCWAACIKMVLNYYGVSITQKQIVARTYKANELGQLPNWPATYKTIHKNLNNWGIDNNGIRYKVTAKIFPGAPDPRLLLTELKNKRPIILAYSNGNNTGHAVIITGASYEVKNANIAIKTVVVRDPWPNEENIKTFGRVEYFGKDLADLMNAFWLVRVE